MTSEAFGSELLVAGPSFVSFVGFNESLVKLDEGLVELNETLADPSERLKRFNGRLERSDERLEAPAGGSKDLRRGSLKSTSLSKGLTRG